MDDNLLQDYMKKWALFTQSIPAVNFIFRYLNKNWIPRAIDECKPYVFHIDVVRPCTRPLARLSAHPTARPPVHTARSPTRLPAPTYARLRSPARVCAGHSCRWCSGAIASSTRSAGRSSAQCSR